MDLSGLILAPTQEAEGQGQFIFVHHTQICVGYFTLERNVTGKKKRWEVNTQMSRTVNIALYV